VGEQTGLKLAKLENAPGSIGHVTLITVSS